MIFMPGLISVHDQQVNIARKASASLIDDLLDKLISFAGNINENKGKLALILGNALDLYNEVLLTQVDNIGITKLHLQNATFDLDELAIENLEHLNNTQRLLLHQVRINNLIKTKLKDLTETISLSSIKDLLNGLVALDDYALYMAKFPGMDPESFRKFQILNHYAYISFNSYLYEETIYKLPNHEKTTINKYIQDFIDTIYAYPTELVLKESYNSSTDYQEELVQNFLMALKTVLKKSTTEQEDIIEKIRAIIPSLLQISNTENNEHQLKLCINELIELEKTDKDFVLTPDFFNSYFDACYKEHTQYSQAQKEKIQQEKALAQERISDYILYVRNIKNEAQELPQIKARLDVLEAIKSKVTQLQLKELLTSSLISENLNVDLKQMLARIAEIGFDTLTEFLCSSSDFIQKNKEKLTRFKEAYHIEGNVELLVDYIENKLNEHTITPRAQYYTGLLNIIEKNRTQHYVAINKYIKAKIDRAEFIVRYPHNSDSEVIAADKLSVIPTNVYNPLANKMNYHMPKDIVDKLIILDTIEQEITAVNDELHQFAYLMTEGNKTPAIIQSSLKHLAEIKANLIAKQNVFESNLLQFSVAKIALLLEEQQEEFLQQNREQLNHLFPISLDEKERLDAEVCAKTKMLAKKLDELKAYLALPPNDSKELLAKQLLEVRELIAQLESEPIAGKTEFDFTQIKPDLNSLMRFYTNDKANKLAGIKSLNQKRAPIPFNHGETTPELIAYAKNVTRFMTWISPLYTIYSNLSHGISAALGLIYRAIARLSSNNKALLRRIDNLAQECKDQELFTAELAQLRDKVGRFSVKPSDIIAQYEEINARHLLRKNHKATKVESQPAESSANLVAASPVAPVSPVAANLLLGAAEYNSLLQRLLASPAEATEVAKCACYAATSGITRERIKTKFEELEHRIMAELRELHQQLGVLLPDVGNAAIKVLSSQIRTLEQIKLQLDTVKQQHQGIQRTFLWEDEITDAWIAGADALSHQIDDLDYQLKDYFDAATSAQKVVHCLKHLVRSDAASPEAAMQTLLKNAVSELAQKDRKAAFAGANIAKTTLHTVFKEAPEVITALTETLGSAHELVACKNIINASFNAIAEQLQQNTDIKALEKACKKAASIALTKELAHLGGLVFGQSRQLKDKEFQDKLKKLAETISDYLLRLYAASQGLQLLLLLADREPKVCEVLQNILFLARDSITEALIQGKTTEEITELAKVVVCEEINKALGEDFIPSFSAKKIVHPNLLKPSLEERLQTTIAQLTLELQELQGQQNQETPIQAIALKIKEKTKTQSLLKEIQEQLNAVLAKEVQLHAEAKAYPFDEEQFKVIYQERYALLAQRKSGLEQDLESVLSPGVMAEFYSFMSKVYSSLGERTQDAAALAVGNILHTTTECIQQNETPADTAFKVLDVTLQSFLGVLNTLDYGNSTADRKETINNLIKKALAEAIRANHEHSSPNLDPMFLAKQALIRVLQELQNPQIFAQITVNWWKNSQVELFAIGSNQAISKLSEPNSTLSQAAEVFCSAIYTHVHSLWLPNPLQIAVKMILKPNPPMAATPAQPSMLSKLSMFTTGLFQRGTKAPVQSDNASSAACRLFKTSKTQTRQMVEEIKQML